ncbi:hypothetical protein DFJ77DRAFT_514038 [Powellomyces hirtus]|nr:hypothetical protein DFJ77DRAFT_514038 [Powellomyces hirtus]
MSDGSFMVADAGVGNGFGMAEYSESPLTSEHNALSYSALFGDAGVSSSGVNDMMVGMSGEPIHPSPPLQNHFQQHYETQQQQQHQLQQQPSQSYMEDDTDVMALWLRSNESMEVATDNAGFPPEFKDQAATHHHQPQDGYLMMDALRDATAQMSMNGGQQTAAAAYLRNRSLSEGSERLTLAEQTNIAYPYTTPVMTLGDHRFGDASMQQQQQQHQQRMQSPLVTALVSPPPVDYSMFPVQQQHFGYDQDLQMQQLQFQQQQQQRFQQQQILQLQHQQHMQQHLHRQQQQQQQHMQTDKGTRDDSVMSAVPPSAAPLRRARANTIPGSSAAHLLKTETGSYNSSTGNNSSPGGMSSSPHSPLYKQPNTAKRHELHAPYSLKSPHSRLSNRELSAYRPNPTSASTSPTTDATGKGMRTGLAPIATNGRDRNMSAPPLPMLAPMVNSQSAPVPMFASSFPLPSPAVNTPVGGPAGLLFSPASGATSASKPGAIPLLPIPPVHTRKDQPTLTPTEQYAKLDAELLAADFDDITVAELKDMLRNRSLPSSGKKAVLLQRLQDEITLIAKRKDGTLKSEDDPRHPLYHQVKQMMQLRQLQMFHQSMMGFDPNNTITASPTSAGPFPDSINTSTPSPVLHSAATALSTSPQSLSSPLPNPAILSLSPLQVKPPGQQRRVRPRSVSDPRVVLSKSVDWGSPLRNPIVRQIRVQQQQPFDYESDSSNAQHMQLSSTFVTPNQGQQLPLLAPAAPTSSASWSQESTQADVNNMAAFTNISPASDFTFAS